MHKPSQRLENFVSDSTRGRASPIPPGEDMGGDRVWSGNIAEIDERTFQFYMNDNAGPPKMKQDDWFIFSDARLVTQPGGGARPGPFADRLSSCSPTRGSRSTLFALRQRSNRPLLRLAAILSPLSPRTSFPPPRDP